MSYENLTAPAAGALLPVDRIGSANFPRTKVSFGAEGTATDVSSAAPLPVAFQAAAFGIKTAALSLSVAPASDATFPLAASEAYVGKNGGDVYSVTAIPVVSTTAYTAGDVVGTKLTLANASRVAAGSGIVQALMLHSKGALTGSFDVLLFSADPTNSTFTDNAALALNVADFDKLVGVVHITDWTSLGTPSLGQALALGLPFKLAASTSLFAVIVARGTPTLGSTSALTLTARIIPG